MELYILDDFFKRVAVIDVFESLLWTDRYRELGDFQLVIPVDLVDSSVIMKDVMVACDSSYRVMRIESIEESSGSDGKRVWTITGNSLEKVLVQRAAMGSWDDTDPDTGTPTWDFTDTPAEIAREMFTEICVNGILSESDEIPYLTGTSVFPSDTIDEPSDPITMQIPPMSLYDAIKQLCDLFDMGFRLTRNPLSNLLTFDIYMGRDRTSAQTEDAAVIFSQGLDNLTNTKEFTSVDTQMNTAYVFSPIGTKKVYTTDASDDTLGFDRKVLMVNASDLTEATDVDAALTQRGFVALAEHRGVTLFDGEINLNNSYKYGVDYHVGDLVEQRSSTGVANFLRVTEQIMVSDSQGERSYPTLTKNLTVTPGTWAGWPVEDEWQDMGEIEWDDLP